MHRRDRPALPVGRSHGRRPACALASPTLIAEHAENSYVRVADVVRSGFVEGTHFGRVLGLARDGSIAFALGDVAAPIHPRSTNKLMQAAGMVSVGLDLSAEELALSAASHWGQPKHVDAVREVLSRSDLDEQALLCPPALPEDDDARRTAVEAGRSNRRPSTTGALGSTQQC